MACRSLRIDGRNSDAQSVVIDRSRPSVNLLPIFTFRVTSPTDWMSARFRSLLGVVVVDEEPDGSVASVVGIMLAFVELIVEALISVVSAGFG